MSSGENSGSILVGGDIHLNRENPTSAFEDMHSELTESDLLVANLEHSLSQKGEPSVTKGIHLRVDPSMIEGLDYADFDLLSLANNHTMDFGRDALEETIEHLEDSDIEPIGAGRNLEEAEQVRTATVNGVEVGFLAFEATKYTMKLVTQAEADSPGLCKLSVSPEYRAPQVPKYDMKRLGDLTSAASEQVDVLFVIFHAGLSSDYDITIAQEGLTHHAIDNGADAVIGGQAPILQPIEFYKSRPIFHSLGHFVFDPFNEEYQDVFVHDILDFPRGRESALVEFVVDEDGLAESRVHPVYIEKEKNQPVSLDPDSDEFREISDWLGEMSNPLGAQLVREDDYLVVTE